MNFKNWFEVTDSLFDRLTSYCNWAAKEFKFDGFHFARDSKTFALNPGAVYVRFYREKDKEPYVDKDSYDESKPLLVYAYSKDKPIKDIIRFFKDSGYDCTASENSIRGVTVVIKNI